MAPPLSPASPLVSLYRANRRKGCSPFTALHYARQEITAAEYNARNGDRWGWSEDLRPKSYEITREVWTHPDIDPALTVTLSVSYDDMGSSLEEEAEGMEVSIERVSRRYSRPDEDSEDRPAPFARLLSGDRDYYWIIPDDLPRDWTPYPGASRGTVALARSEEMRRRADNAYNYLRKRVNDEIKYYCVSVTVTHDETGIEVYSDSLGMIASEWNGKDNPIHYFLSDYGAAIVDDCKDWRATVKADLLATIQAKGRALMSIEMSA